MTPEIYVPPLLCLLFGYVLGSVPFGLLLTRAAGLGRRARRSARAISARPTCCAPASKGLAAATLLLDAGKGAAAVAAGGPGSGPICPRPAAIAGIGAFLGHLFPVWLALQGRQGGGDAGRNRAARLHWPSLVLIIAGFGLAARRAGHPLFLARRDDGSPSRRHPDQRGLLLRPGTIWPCSSDRLRLARFVDPPRQSRAARSTAPGGRRSGGKAKAG